MDKRWGGLLVVVVALTAALALSGSLALRVPGAALVGPPPGPPEVGDCVAAPLDSLPLPGDGVTGGYHVAKTLPCNGSRFGEVAAVLTDPTPAPEPVTRQSVDPATGEPITSTSWPEDGNTAVCAARAATYAGVPTDDGTGWRSAAQINSAIVQPDVRQSAAGQHWIACLVVAAPNAAVAYSTPIRGMYADGYPADLISRCGPSVDAFDSIQTSCGSAHRTEYFGFTTVLASTSLSKLQANCAAEIARRTRVPDPTMGGAFRVSVSAYYFSVNGYQMGGLQAGGSASCKLEAVDPHRVLDHSLAGLGARPIPWA